LLVLRRRIIGPRGHNVFVDRSEPGGWRVWPIVVGFGLLLLAVAAIAAYVINEQLADSRDREVRDVAIERAQLLNEVGRALPELTAQKLRQGFTTAELTGISTGIARLRETQPLVGVAIFDSRQRLLYPATGGARVQVPAGISQALRGSPAVEEHPRGGAPSIDAAVPIHDPDGSVIGVLSVELDADELREGVGEDQTRVVATLLGGTALLWLLLIPLSLRVARVAAPYISLARWRTLRGVRHALETGGLEVHYQPKIALATREPCGAEGLVRWRRDGALVSAGEFLPYVDKPEILSMLTRFVLDRAVGDAAAWQRAGHQLGVAVNLAPHSLTDDTLPQLIEATLSKHGLDAGSLTVEVTERGVLNEPTRVKAVLDALAGLGVAISIDDFGTGQASLARLRGFPIHEVKIDRSFVARMTLDERPFVDAITTMAQALGLRVVAEGVEDRATLELLASGPCNTAQGFLFCRPVPLEEFLAWLERPGSR